ncbi:Hpt domain-containing protein [Zhongshania sp. BJYM1]|jgi:HPt (histidine-containing phosphotransfer) domain-containing protein|uniref:Hpt domain-containing protein n=1 Tax=Zhongshania aquatica TaxID=2965069 RepID=UPI0022B5C93F|nr:Hpt domain-containing protein [Marortus sp. BJYM1]
MILDHDRVQDLTRNNTKLIASISQLFLAELPDMIRSVEKAYEQSDRKSLSIAIHRLKSAVGNFAVKSFYEQFSRLELLALGNNAPVMPLSDWLNEWDTTKAQLNTMVIELKDMAGI